MLRVRVIPCLDVRGGRVVKGVRFRDLADQGDPAELAARYEREGADEIVILDVAATGAGRLARLDTVRRVRARIAIPLTVGGGVRDADDARALLESGADRVAVNTAAVERPALLTEIAARFGSQCAVLALDAARMRPEGGSRDAAPDAGRADSPGAPLARARAGRALGGAVFEVLTRSGSSRTGHDAAVWGRRAEALGAGEILLTSFDRDGTRAGYDLDLIGALREAVSLPIIASGGAASPGHMCAAVAAGADAVLAASMFHQGDWSVGRLKDRLARLGVAVRR